MKKEAYLTIVLSVIWACCTMASIASHNGGYVVVAFGVTCMTYAIYWPR